MTKLVNAQEMAWAAGFYEGEGCVSAAVTGPRGYMQLVLVIPQTNREVLDRFQRFTGHGTVRGPYGRKSSIVQEKPDGSLKRYNPKPYWQFKISNAGQVRAVIDALWPYLGPVKQAQALEVFSKYDGYRARMPSIVNPGYRTGRTVKLTQDQREEIAARAAAGETIVALAKEFGIDQSTVSWWALKLGKTYHENCEGCGVPLAGRRRRFCTPECRQASWARAARAKRKEAM